MANITTILWRYRITEMHTHIEFIYSLYYCPIFEHLKIFLCYMIKLLIIALIFWQ